MELLIRKTISVIRKMWLLLECLPLKSWNYSSSYKLARFLSKNVRSEHNDMFISLLPQCLAFLLGELWFVHLNIASFKLHSNELYLPKGTYMKELLVVEGCHSLLVPETT